MMRLSHSQSAYYYYALKTNMSSHSFHGDPMTSGHLDIWACLHFWCQSRLPLDLRSPFPQRPVSSLATLNSSCPWIQLAATIPLWRVKRGHLSLGEGAVSQHYILSHSLGLILF